MPGIKLMGGEKILIVRPDRIGDLVLTLPMAKVLKRVYPELEIHFLVSGYNAQVLNYADYIDDFILISDQTGQPRTAGKLAEILEDQNYNLAIMAKPGWLSSFACYLAGIPIRLGTSRRFYSFLFNERVEIKRRYSNMHEIDLNLMILESFGINSEPGAVYPDLQSHNSKSTPIPEMDSAKRGEYVIVHPGSKGSAPNWPPNLYQELIWMLAEDTKVAVTGQSDLTAEFSGNIINLINKTDFGQLISVISGARLFISGSTGPLHIAAALGNPVLGLYPNHPTAGPRRWAPRGKHTSYLTPVEQNGHFCHIKDNGSCDCMESIAVKTVYNKARQILSMEKSES